MGTFIDASEELTAVVRTRRVATTEDARAFSEGIEPHLATMLRLARRLGRENAEDIVQESLARAWTKRGQYDPSRGSFGAWLLAITADQAYKSWRWHFRHNRPLLQQPDAEAVGPDALIDLERSIRHLPARQRQAVDCHYFAGLTVAETAAVMRCSEGNVKSLLSAARSGLRELMG